MREPPGQHNANRSAPAVCCRIGAASGARGQTERDGEPVKPAVRHTRGAGRIELA